MTTKEILKTFYKNNPNIFYTSNRPTNYTRNKGVNNWTYNCDLI